jgi:glycosyltransferase involved in cell wall biosynthesis
MERGLPVRNSLRARMPALLLIMKILMIAPEPFFEPRGTPFSEYFRIKALSELGHQVDLATYPLGQNVEIPGLRIHRSLSVPGISRVKVGPSIGKLFLDFFLFFTVLKLLFKNRYDAVHTHEEACFWGAILRKIWKIPHVYDMHSSLPQQFKNFNIVHAGWVHKILQAFEKFALQSSDAIIAICPYLKDHVVDSGVTRKVFVIENSAESEFPRQDTPAPQIPDFTDKKIVLYAGTFEHYQGLDLLLESAALIAKKREDILFLLVGGDSEFMPFYQEMSNRLGLSQVVRLIPKIFAAEVRAYIEIADVLVSPRKSGTNTPLKIYSYLRSGKPIVATNLVTHTQVLTPEISILTEPDPNSFTNGILRALESSDTSAMVQRAAQVAREKYSYEEYVNKTAQLYNYVQSLKTPNQLQTANSLI